MPTMRIPTVTADKDELRAHLSDREQDLRRALKRLERSARAQIDFRRLLADNADLMLAGAVVVGFVLGIRRRGRDTIEP